MNSDNHGLEIERRWLLASLPERVAKLKPQRIVQGYAECHLGEMTVTPINDSECLLALQLPHDFPGAANFSWSTSAPQWVYEHLSLAKNQGKVRVRQIDGEVHILTVKADGDLARLEWEVEVPLQIARFLFHRAQKRLVFKYRTQWPDGSHTLEFDVFNHTLTGLIILECEFASMEDAQSKILPSWIGDVEEITTDKRYSNKNLALHGLP